MNHSFDGCPYFGVSRLNRVITRLAEECFAKSGLAPTSAFLLMLVEAEPGICPKALSEQLHITPSTVTRFLDKLESGGLLTRRCEGKQAYVYPTPKGSELQASIQEQWNELGRRLCGVLGEDASRELSALANDAADKLKAE